MFLVTVRHVLTMSCLEIAARRESRRMHKREVTAIIDTTETSVARKHVKARPPLGTIDLLPLAIFLLTEQTHRVVRKPQTWGIITGPAIN